MGNMIAHQWFGNLITMEGWNDLWLSDGFATYFQYAAANAYQPSYAYYSYFYTEITSK